MSESTEKKPKGLEELTDEEYREFLLKEARKYFLSEMPPEDEKDKDYNNVVSYLFRIDMKLSGLGAILEEISQKLDTPK